MSDIGILYLLISVVKFVKSAKVSLNKISHKIGSVLNVVFQNVHWGFGSTLKLWVLDLHS